MKLPLNQRQDATVEQLREQLDEAMGDQDRRWTAKNGWQPTRITAERDPKQFGDKCDLTWFGMILHDWIMDNWNFTMERKDRIRRNGDLRAICWRFNQSNCGLTRFNQPRMVIQPAQMRICYQTNNTWEFTQPKWGFNTSSQQQSRNLHIQGAKLRHVGV